MRVVVTGGAGFIGSHLVSHLVDAGHEVAILDDFSTGRQENLAAGLDRISVVRGSVAEPDDCERAIAGAELVFHQAALPSVPRSVRDPRGTHEANATGTLNVLIAAHKFSVRRVIYASSSSVYGDSPQLPNVEDTACSALSPYAASKLTGEAYCRAFFASYGLETVMLRYFNVFGPRQDPTSPYSAAIPKLMSAALAGDRPVIYGDGGQSRDFTYVANVIHANLLAMNAPSAAAGEAFNIACGRRISVLDLWQRIRDLAGVTVEPVHVDPRPGEVRNSVASIVKAGRLLGYEPVVGLEQGLQETLESLTITAR